MASVPAISGEYVALPEPGIYRTTHATTGRLVCYAVDDAGQVLEMRMLRTGETEDDLIAGLADLLDQPKLTLLADDASEPPRSPLH